MKKLFHIFFLLISLSGFASTNLDSLKPAYFNLLNNSKEAFELIFKEAYSLEFKEEFSGDFFVLSTNTSSASINSVIELSPLAQSTLKGNKDFENLKFLISLEEKNDLFTLSLENGLKPEVITGDIEEIRLYMVSITNTIKEDLNNYE